MVDTCITLKMLNFSKKKFWLFTGVSDNRINLKSFSNKLLGIKDSFFQITEKSYVVKS